MIVLGLGPSIKELARIERRPTTIGVNDVERHVGTVDHLVLLDAPADFLRTNGRARGTERLRTVTATRAGTVWIFDRHLDRWPSITANHPDVRPLKIRVARHDEPLMHLDPESDELAHFQISPYTGASLAFRLGAKRIGLLGVDLIPGDHPVAVAAHTIDVRLGRLRGAMAQHGVDLVNLSPLSTLTSLPRKDIEEWTATPKS